MTYVTFVTYFEADLELVRVTSFEIIVPFVVQCNPFAFCKSSNQFYFNIIISSGEPVITFSVIFKRSRCEGQIGLNHQWLNNRVTVHLIAWDIACSISPEFKLLFNIITYMISFMSSTNYFTDFWSDRNRRKYLLKTIHKYQIPGKGWVDYVLNPLWILCNLVFSYRWPRKWCDHT